LEKTRHFYFGLTLANALLTNKKCYVKYETIHYFRFKEHLKKDTLDSHSYLRR